MASCGARARPLRYRRTREGEESTVGTPAEGVLVARRFRAIPKGINSRTKGSQLLMWNTRSVQLNVRLPKDVASEAEEVQRSDPDFLSRVIQYGLTRRSIYHRLREVEGRGAPAIGRRDDSGPGLLRP